MIAHVVLIFFFSIIIIILFNSKLFAEVGERKRLESCHYGIAVLTHKVDLRTSFYSVYFPITFSR